MQLQQIIEPPCWTISSVNFYEFLHKLPKFAPEHSILCLEGIVSSEIESYLQDQTAIYENELNQGFLKLHTKIYYTPITEINIRDFATISENYAAPEICSHLRIYENDKLILSWHDLPFDSIYFADRISPAISQTFGNSARFELN